MNLITRLRKMLRNESGQDLLEYALLIGLIAIVAIAGLTATGTSVNGLFTKISGVISKL